MIIVDTNILIRYLLNDVDCILFAYYKNENFDIKTFDKKLCKLINDN